jgi:hypothetical protein
MSELLTVLVIVGLISVAITLIIVFAAIKAVQATRRQARRARNRIASALPAHTFGNQVWWLAARTDRISDQAEYAVRIAARSGFLASEVECFAAELHAGCAATHDHLRAVGHLAGAPRAAEIRRLEEEIRDLEAGASALVSLAVRAAESVLHSQGASRGEYVRRRAEAMQLALDELSEIESQAEGQMRVLQPGDVDAGAGFVAGVQRDQQRRERLYG